jgi:DNA repair protein RecN (Recombination protein N)
MLKQLSIKNYAIIDSLEIDFNNGFSVLTGETGSGKSIILGALQLLMGQRADSKSILNANDKCIIEGTFSIENYHLNEFFTTNDLDFDAKETIIRREISSNGKSRAFINDSPVSLAILKALSGNLIDIHSQHQTVLLNNANYQLQLVDSLAQVSTPNHKQVLFDYKNGFTKLKSIEKELNSVLNDGEESKSQLDYLSFLYQELQEANLVKGEKELLESQIKIAENKEEVSIVLKKVVFVLETNHVSETVNTQLFNLIQDLQNISSYNTNYADLSERLNSTAIELADISKESETLLSSFDSDGVDIEMSRVKLNLINQLEQKHRVSSFDELLDKFDEIGESLHKIDSIDTTIEKLEDAIKNLKLKLTKMATKISSNRSLVGANIEGYIVATLVELGIKNGQFKASIASTTELNEWGADAVSFLFSANKGVELQEMSKVASGGETSRLMLAIKALLAKHLALPCLVLDEIDTGVSGEIASKIAKILTEMSSEIQLIVISHLPQVAAKGKTHYKVEKIDFEGKTQTKIRQLSPTDRVNEIAKMLSGERISNAALENAKALMTNY